MKNFLPVLLIIAGSILYGFVVAQNSTPNPNPNNVVNITAHDATGRTVTGQAKWNSMKYQAVNGQYVISLDYTTDQLFCSAFGPGQ